MSRIDLTKQKFGRWTVIEFAGTNKSRGTMWLCECSCDKHTRKVVSGASLRGGISCSCGCLSVEKSKERFLKSNPKFKGFNCYQEIEDGYKVFDDKGNSFEIDKEDLKRITPYRWYKNDSEYWIAQMYPQGKRKLQRLHRFIMNAKSGDIIDHIDRNRSNNKKNNLRFCSPSQNSMNSSMSKQNSSGFIGVSYYKASDCWESHIGVEGEKKELGHYKEKREAVIARLKAEKEYFGEFAPQQHLFEEYGIE